MIRIRRYAAPCLSLIFWLMVLTSGGNVFADDSNMTGPALNAADANGLAGADVGGSGSVQADMDRLVAENSQLREKLERLSDAKALDDQLDSAMTLITAYEDMIAELQERIAGLETELASPSPEAEELQAQVEALTRENEELRSRLDVDAAEAAK